MIIGATHSDDSHIIIRAISDAPERRTLHLYVTLPRWSLGFQSFHSAGNPRNKDVPALHEGFFQGIEVIGRESVTEAFGKSNPTIILSGESVSTWVAVHDCTTKTMVMQGIQPSYGIPFFNTFILIDVFIIILISTRSR